MAVLKTEIGKPRATFLSVSRCSQNPLMGASVRSVYTFHVHVEARRKHCVFLHCSLPYSLETRSVSDSESH